MMSSDSKSLQVTYSNKQEDEEYWSSTSARSFNFNLDNESEDGCSIFGVSQAGAAQLSRQMRAGVNWNDLSPEDSIASSTLSATASEAIDRLSLTHKSIRDVTLENERENYTAADLPRLKSELISLKRQVLSAREERFVPLTPGETVVRIMLDQPYSLEGYKALEDKKLLLDEAIKLGDGNAILVVVLFLSKTLSKMHFRRFLMEYPDAANHYVNHLIIRHVYPEVTDVLAMLGRSKSAAMLRLQHVLSSYGNPETRLAQLQKCQQLFFLEGTGDVDDSLVAEFVSLMTRQLQISSGDNISQWEIVPAASKNSASAPTSGNICGQSVLSTLHYCCLHHWDKSDSQVFSPMTVCKNHGLSDRQFVSVALQAKAELQDWNGIDGLFAKKSWLGGTKLKAVLPFEDVVHVLAKYRAPSKVLAKYLQAVESTKKKLALAKRLQCHEVVVDTLASQGDRQALELYQKTLEPHSQANKYASDALRVSTNKWKN